MQIILYVWGTKNQVKWGNWHERIQIRQVPYTRFYQEFVARIFYYFWARVDSPDSFLINFLYHGETVIPKSSTINYVLHSPASLIKNRYINISSVKDEYERLSFIAVSDGVKKDAIPFLSPHPIHVIHHGIDLKKFSHKQNYKINGKIKIATVAALESWKGIQNIISSFSDPYILNKFSYDIIGEGPFESTLKEMVHDLQIESSIKFLGQIEHVESLLPSYDIYCQLSEGEAFGISVIEAMACGLPTIVSNCPPFDTLFSNEVLKVNPNSQEEIIKNLKFLKSEEVRMGYGNKGREYVHSNFSLEQMGHHYFNQIWGEAT